MSIRAVASVVVLTAAALVLAGCQFVTPQATLKQYSAGYGASGTTGSVSIRNALIVVDNNADPSSNNGNLVFTAVNSADEATQLNVQYQNATQQISLEPISVAAGPDSVTKIGQGSAGQTFLPQLNATPGSLAKVYFQAGTGEGVQLMVPVLTGEQAVYATLQPTTPPTPTAAPTGTPTPTPSATKK